MKTTDIDARNCPIRQHTADGVSCGRCWYYVGEGPVKTCPIHGDVTQVVKHYVATGHLTNDEFRVGTPPSPAEGCF